LAALILGFCTLACASPLPAAPDPGPLPAGALRVRLVFGTAADLDLYVTDPHQETVYFANTPSISGGTLSSDVRCDAPAPRVETVLFTAPLAGTYRVGVDHPERCGVARGEVPFRVEIEVGSLRRTLRGEIPWGHFRAQLIDFEVGPESAETGSE
jgi:hypothetical protein